MNMKKQIFSNFPLGIKKIILITLILTLVLIGCKKVEEVESAIEAETTPDISIESDVSEIDSLDEDLGLGELENLEKELDEINW